MPKIIHIGTLGIPTVDELLLKLVGLAGQGGLALLLALALLALYRLFQRYEQVQEKRISDATMAAERQAAAWKIVESLRDERAELINALEVLRRSVEHRGSSEHRGRT